MLAYGVTTDFMDEYLKIGGTTITESLKRFVQAVISIFSEEYLRSPNNEDIARLLAEGKKVDFQACWGVLIACTGNGTTAQLRGKVYILVIFTNQLLFWKQWLHMIFRYGMLFFSLLGSHNDINVLEMSFIFSDLTQRRTPHVNYTVNGHNYNMGYYLANGIYPQWAIFVKQFHLHKEIRENTLQKPMSRQGKMWRGRLEYFKHNLL
jgi:hypothetical protein